MRDDERDEDDRQYKAMFDRRDWAAWERGEEMKICELCGEPLQGDEPYVHGACADYENFLADAPYMDDIPPHIERWRPIVEKYMPPHLVDKMLHVIRWESNGDPTDRPAAIHDAIEERAHD